MENLQATTTLEQDMASARNRTINLIMEITQMILALSLTGATIYMAIRGIASAELSNAFFLIIGFYFGKSFTERAQNVVKR